MDIINIKESGSGAEYYIQRRKFGVFEDMPEMRNSELIYYEPLARNQQLVNFLKLAKANRAENLYLLITDDNLLC